MPPPILAARRSRGDPFERTTHTGERERVNFAAGKGDRTSKLLRVYIRRKTYSARFKVFFSAINRCTMNNKAAGETGCPSTVF